MTQLQFSERVQQMKPSATLGMAQAARELQDAGVDVVVLSAGEPDFSTPQIVCDVAKRSLDQGKTHYVPVRGTKTLVSALQKKFLRDQGIHYKDTELMCTAGAKSAILLALEAIVNPGDEVIIFAPYWVSYVAHIRLAGGIAKVVTCTAENNFMPTKEQLTDAITKQTRAIILNSPNNPSGGVISRQRLLEISEVLADTDIWLLSDEIYEKIIFDGVQHVSPAAINQDMRERTLIITGASKGYAMTGWRVGVVAGNEKIIGAMVKLQGQQVTCLPEFIQDAAAFAFEENHEMTTQIQSMVEAYGERREVGFRLFEKLPFVRMFKPQGAFYFWADFSELINKELYGNTVCDDVDLATRMLKEAHVASVPGTPFGAPGFIRFSIASSIEDISNAAQRISLWLSGDGKR